MPRIEFTPRFQTDAEPPRSARLPSWYVDMNRGLDEMPTVRRCLPVLDFLSSGYLLTFPVDLCFLNNSWDRTDIVLTHPVEQFAGLAVPAGYSNKIVFKLANPFKISTPPGYSCLFLPVPELSEFYALPGVVDTDTFPVPVNPPFLIPKNFEGNITAGTPLVRVIPFKREEWDSVVCETDFQIISEAFKINLKTYRDKFWKRKFWK